MSSETSSIAKPRGRPFEKGNSGRPKGARNKTTQAIEHLLEGQAEAITAKVIELALEGDLAALRLCLDRLYSVRNERTISLDLPHLNPSPIVAWPLPPSSPRSVIARSRLARVRRWRG